MIQTLTLTSQFTGNHLRPPSITAVPTAGKPSISAAHAAMPVMMKPASLYEVLRVERTATLPEIKKAFRNLAKVYHPDAGYERNGDGEFIEIRNAYMTLSDPVAREMYDMKSRRRSVVVAGGERRGFYGSRRWETDQCW